MMTVKEEAERYFNAAAERFSNKDYEGSKNYFLKAIEGLTKAIDLDANDKDVYRRRGLTYLSIGDYSKAIDDFTKAIALSANDKDIYDMRGFAYLRIKDYAKAMEDYTKAIALGANDKDVYFRRGLAYFGMDNYPKAIRDCTKAIESGANDKVIYKIRGSAYKQIKNYQKAIEDLTKAIELGANDKDVYDMRGLAYLSQRDYPKVIEDLTKAIELGASNKDIYNRRGLAYLSLKDYLKAIEDFTRAIGLGANDKSIYQNRGTAYVGINNYPKAIEDFTKAIELDESDKSAYGNRGIVYIGIQNYAKAIDDLTNAIDLGEKDKIIYRNRGIAHLGIDKYQEAIDDLTKAIDLGEKDKAIYKNRGIAHLGIDKYQEAIDDLTEAIKLGEKGKVIYRIRGISYIGAKNYSKAIRDFKKVVKLNKDGKKKENNTGNRDYIPDKIKLTDNLLDLIYYILQSNESNDLPEDETLNLIKLICSCYDLMEEIRINPSDVKKEKIVHYTKASTVQYLLKKDHSAKLRLNNAVYMNDPEEGQTLKKVLCQLGQNNELENLFKDENVKNYTYLTCFSLHDERNELPMWVHYGDGGKGVGLVFHDSFFDKADLYKVQYIDTKKADIDELNQNVKAIFEFLKKDEIKDNDHKEFKDYVNIILNYVSYLFKDKAYEYENEVRILNYRNCDSQDIKTDDAGRDIPRLFIEYDKCISKENCVEVIAGPKAQYTEIAAYAKYVGIPTVSQSEIKYR